jgi:hypothetical protein
MLALARLHAYASRPNFQNLPKSIGMWRASTPWPKARHPRARSGEPSGIGFPLKGVLR